MRLQPNSLAVAREKFSIASWETVCRIRLGAPRTTLSVAA
jgi:hypothetical protein